MSDATVSTESSSAVQNCSTAWKRRRITLLGSSFKKIELRYKIKLSRFPKAVLFTRPLPVAAGVAGNPTDDT
jgi:hypothetical protein